MSLGWNRRTEQADGIALEGGRHRAPGMTYKAYIDNIRAKTGKGPEYYQRAAKKKGLVKYGELLAWLKSDCGLGHGHANAMILYIRDPELAKKKMLEDGKKKAKV